MSDDIFPPDAGKSDGLPRQSRPPGDTSYVPFSVRLGAQRGGDPADVPDAAVDLQRAVDRASLIQEAEQLAESYEGGERLPRRRLFVAALLGRLTSALQQAHNENKANAQIIHVPEQVLSDGRTIRIRGSSATGRRGEQYGVGFEEKVASAPNGILLEARHCGPDGIWGPIGEVLAPRVTAAIEAASLGRNVRAELSAESQNAALDAMQGRKPCAACGNPLPFCGCTGDHDYPKER